MAAEAADAGQLFRRSIQLIKESIHENNRNYRRYASELADLRAVLPYAKQETHAGYKFYSCEYKGKRIVNVCCGVAKVNAALCAQVLIDRMGAEVILNAGIAGG